MNNIYNFSVFLNKIKKNKHLSWWKIGIFRIIAVNVFYGEKNNVLQRCYFCIVHQKDTVPSAYIHWWLNDNYIELYSLLIKFESWCYNDSLYLRLWLHPPLNIFVQKWVPNLWTSPVLHFLMSRALSFTHVGKCMKHCCSFLSDNQPFMTDDACSVKYEHNSVYHNLQS